MRNIGLVFAGFLVTTCGGPNRNSSSNEGAAVYDGVAASNDVAMPEDPPVRPAPKIPATKTNVGPQPHPCLMQGPDHLRVAAIRAVGTEPFWGARVQGRCVTYSTPENQQGVRVWTRYSETGSGSSKWVGQLSGKIFEMRVRLEPDCSDGMSDRRYPMVVDLAVNGEKRKGCAEPL